MSQSRCLFLAAELFSGRHCVVFGWQCGFFFVIKQIVIDVVWKLGITRKGFGSPFVQPFLLLSGIAYEVLPGVAGQESCGPHLLWRRQTATAHVGDQHSNVVLSAAVIREANERFASFFQR